MSLRNIIAKRVDQLCTAMGTALYQVQGVEEILAKYYAIVFKLSDSPSLDEITEEFDRNFTHTAGRLVGLLRDKRGKDDPIAIRLSSFVDERAWLVHKLRRTDYLNLKTEEGYLEILQRISKVEKESEALIELFHNLLVDYFVSLGTPREVIEREHAKAIKEVYEE